MKAPRTISIAVIVLLGAAMAWVSWGFWADPIFANGRELYVPWQLSQGKILYRDIAHNNGPFSPYFDAAIFKIFSPRVHVLVFANFIWLIALIAMVWWLWRFIAGLFAATVACVLLLTLFAFVQLTGTGGFNFILPYEQEMTHGLILSFAAIFCLTEYARHRTDRVGWLCAAGIALGLVSLTRASLFVAAFVPVICGAGAAIYAHRLARGRIISHLAILIGSTLLVAVLAFGWMSGTMPPRDVWAALTNSWRWGFDDQLLAMYHTQVWLGLDKTTISADRILLGGVVYALLLLPALALGKALRRPGEARIVAVAVTVVVVLSALYIFYDRINWQLDATAGLALATLGMAVALVTVLLQRQRNRIDAALIVRLTIIWFALFLLVQLGFRSVIFEYGFVLALPAALVSVAATVSWLPGLAERAGGFGWVPRAAALTAISVLLFNHLSLYRRVLPRHPIVIGEGIDALRFDRRGEALREMLAEISSRTTPRETLLALPEGALINFLSRRENPTPYPSLMPIDMLKFGEDRVFESIQHSPPDWLVISTVSTEQFGSKSFAEGYGKEIWRWMRPRYEPMADHGERGFVMRLFRRIDRPVDHRVDPTTQEAR